MLSINHVCSTIKVMITVFNFKEEKMKKAINYIMVLLLSAGVMCCVSCMKKCEPGETQPGYCPDSTVTEQVCKDDGSGWEPADCANKYSFWNDPATNLTWQDPQKDAYTPDDPGLGQQDALRYCEELVLGGYDDWRLPNIDELRTIVRGNPNTMTGGDCPVHDGSSKADMKNPACSPVPDYQGPGDGGCYWALKSPDCVIGRTLLMKESVRSRRFHLRWPVTTGSGWHVFFLMRAPRFSTIFTA